jgi:DNA adenine methylase
VECNTFENVLERAIEGDFVYFDPPYWYPSGEGHISYDNSNTESERTIIHNVREVMDELSRRKVRVALSMSAFPYIRELFADHNIHTVHHSARRLNELVITNY